MSDYDLPDDFKPMSLEEVAAIEADYQAELLTFYDRCKGMHITLEKRSVEKYTLQMSEGIQYRLRGHLPDGRTLSKRIDKNAWRFLDVPQLPQGDAAHSEQESE